MFAERSVTKKGLGNTSLCKHGDESDEGCESHEQEWSCSRCCRGERHEAEGCHRDPREFGDAGHLRGEEDGQVHYPWGVHGEEPAQASHQGRQKDGFRQGGHSEGETSPFHREGFSSSCLEGAVQMMLELVWPFLRYLSASPCSVGILRNRDLLTDTEGKAIQAQASFELRLQGSCWKSLHDGTGWFRLHCDLLAESHPFACLGGWLVSALNHAHPRDSELARLLHL